LITVSYFGRHDIQHNDSQYNAIHYNDTQHKGLICDTQHNNIASTMRALILSVEFNLVLF